MKVSVTGSFIDKVTKEQYKTGDVLDVSSFRAGELFGKGLIARPEVTDTEDFSANDANDALKAENDLLKSQLRERDEKINHMQEELNKKPAASERQDSSPEKVEKSDKKEKAEVKSKTEKGERQ